MRVTVDLEPELWNAAVENARKSSLSVEEALHKAIRAALLSPSEKHSPDSFAFSLPGGIVTTADVTSTLNEDDD